MDELLADFIAETREMLEASSGELVAWEADPSDRARLDTIFRFVHTVKGNCGFFDFPRLARLSHAAEDALAECRAGRRDPDRALVNAVLAIIDRIGEMNDAIEAGEDFPEGGDEQLIAALAQDANAETGGPARIPSDTSTSPEPEEGTKATRNGVQRSIRLPVGLLDEVMKGISDLVLARNDLARRLRQAGEHPDIEGPFERLSAILADVRNSVTKMRMQRLENLFGSLPRLVRDLSGELGKQVMIDFEGGDVEMDREMIEMIRDPLTHIIRNAIGHGIEPPADRLKQGKREIGLLRIAARQSGNQINLVITDDGRGIDCEKLAAKAASAGLYSASELETMAEADKLELIFAPGLSTAEEISAVSGRGVGMDVVRANIEKVGGTIEVTSRKGEGTALHLQLPLTLSIIAALTVSSGGQRYAIPRSFVEEVVLASVQDVEFARAGERQLLTFRGRRVPCIALADVLEPDEDRDIAWEELTLVLVRLASDDIFALGVDKVHDHEDVVVKPIAPVIMETQLYAGTTLLDDGKPLMLLDMPSIAALHGLTGQIVDRSHEENNDPPQNEEKLTTPIMLFEALDGRRRAVRLEMVRRIETINPEAIDTDNSGARVVIEGEILPLVGYDCNSLPSDRCRLMRLSDGETEIAYAVREVLDAANMNEEAISRCEDPTVEGITLIDGQQVQVIEGHTLFSKQSARSRGKHGLVCRVPEDSEWSRTILGPLVKAAGYRIAYDGDADLAIVMEANADIPANARATLRLSAEPDNATGSDIIYRYDREGLLAALERLSREIAA